MAIYLRGIPTWAGVRISQASSDPFYSDVSLLIPGTGTNNSTTFVDNSLTANTITANGNVKISTTPSKFGGGSIAFDGSNDYLTFSNQTFAVFAANDWTIESWVYLNGTGTNQMLIGNLDDAAGAGSWWVMLNSTFQGAFPIQFGYGIAPSGGGINVKSAASGTLTATTWNHLAITRSGSNIRIFINGTQSGATNTGIGTTSIFNSNVPMRIGRVSAGTGPYDLNGNINDMRITKGIARYTSDFTVPDAPFPIS